MDTVTVRSSQVRELIDRQLELFLDAEVERLAFMGADGVAVVRDYLTAFVRDGGKRLRPSFVYWGHRASGGTDEQLDEVLHAACAVELVHAAALLLDDIMDEAPSRRGRPAPHVALADLHRRSDWRGEAPRFGESAATLLALLALAWADAALLRTGARLPEALDILTRLRVEAIGGQYLDLAGTATGAVDARRAGTISVYKSAKYTVERPLHLGHAIAGGPPRTRGLLSAYALPLGEAFQLRDDILGVFGDPARTGKPAGADLVQGKATYLLAYARERAGDLAGILDGGHNGHNGHDSGHSVRAARELIVACGALDAAEERISALVAEAIAALDRIPDIPPDARLELAELAVLATDRSL